MLKNSRPKKDCEYCKRDITDSETKQRFCNQECRRLFNIQESNKKFIERVPKPVKNMNTRFTQLWACQDIPKVK